MKNGSGSRDGPKDRRNSAAGADMRQKRHRSSSNAPQGSRRGPQAGGRESDIATRASQLTKAVVKIFATHCEPNFAVPWTTKAQESSISSGFAFQLRNCPQVPGGLENNRLLLTNAHCVDHAAVIQVRSRGSGERFTARVLSVANDCDLALMTVDDDAFWEGMEHVELVSGSDPPQPGQAVTIVGFPTGGDNTCVTQGVVSRLDLYDYVQSGREFLAIQVDAAINGGNSGGPALNKKGKCVGIAFQSDNGDDIENQGQIIPTEIVIHFLADYVKNGRYTGFPDPGFEVQNLESKFLRQFLGVSDRQTGVRVKSVAPTSPAHSLLQVGDIVTSVDDHAIGNDGNVAYRFGERLPMQYLFHRKFVGDTIAVSIVRNNNSTTVNLPLADKQALVPATVSDAPQYFIVGGLVMVPLTEIFLEHEFGEDFDEDAPASLLAARENGIKQHADEEVVVLSRVLAHGVNVGYEDVENEQVCKFQGAPVRNLRELATRVERDVKDPSVEFVRFELANGDLVVLPREETVRAGPEILRRNLIATHCAFACLNADAEAPASLSAATASTQRSREQWRATESSG